MLGLGISDKRLIGQNTSSAGGFDNAHIHKGDSTNVVFTDGVKDYID